MEHCHAKLCQIRCHRSWRETNSPWLCVYLHKTMRKAHWCQHHRRLALDATGPDSRQGSQAWNTRARFDLLDCLARFTCTPIARSETAGPEPSSSWLSLSLSSSSSLLSSLCCSSSWSAASSISSRAAVASGFDAADTFSLRVLPRFAAESCFPSCSQFCTRP